MLKLRIMSNKQPLSSNFWLISISRNRPTKTHLRQWCCISNRHSSKVMLASATWPAVVHCVIQICADLSMRDCWRNWPRTDHYFRVSGRLQRPRSSASGVVEYELVATVKLMRCRICRQSWTYQYC